MTLNLNLLQNGGFEADWGDAQSHLCKVFPSYGDPFDTEVGNIFTPPGWVTWFAHEPGMWDQPEVRDAWKQNDPRRVHSGEKGMLLFTFFRKHDAGFMQQVEVEPGTKLRLSAYAHAWSNHKDKSQPDRFPHPDDGEWSEGAGYAPKDGGTNILLEGGAPNDEWRNFTFTIGIDPTGGEDPFADTVVWGRGAHIYNEHRQVPAVEAVAEASTVTVFLRSKTLWPFKHNDAYWDDAELIAADSGTVIPPAEPCRGVPREQYQRTYVLIPPTEIISEVVVVCDDIIDDEMWTVGSSADDAGIGDLDVRRIVALNPQDWQGDLWEFYDEWYPGVVITPVVYTNDYQLRGRMLAASLLEKAGGKPFLAYPITHPFPSPYRDYDRNITSEFGEDRGSYHHMGIDLVGSWAAWNDEALSATAGEVVEAGWHNNQGGFGYRVVVRSAAPDGTEILIRYAHLLADVYVNIGQQVAVGQKLGRIGSTGGTSTGDHLHFDVRVGGEYADPEMLMTWPDDEQPPEPPPGPALLELVSLHVQSEREGYPEFVQTVKPQVVKTVLAMERCRQIKEWSPDTLTVFRHWRPDQGEFLKKTDGPRLWLECFLDSLHQNAGVVDYVESLNEMVATGDVAGTSKLVDFDCEFCYELDREMGDAVRPLILNVAVGNPQHGAETELLLPAAHASVQYGGALGYHAYWGSRPDGYCTLDENFVHYSGRALLSWDPVFTAAGLYPTYIFGEGGAVLISESGWLNPNGGWREACRDWNHYGEQIRQFRELAKETDAGKRGDVYGLTLFTLGGGSQWEEFELAGRLDDLAEVLR